MSDAGANSHLPRLPDAMISSKSVTLGATRFELFSVLRGLWPNIRLQGMIGTR